MLNGYYSSEYLLVIVICPLQQFQTRRLEMRHHSTAFFLNPEGIDSVLLYYRTYLAFFAIRRYQGKLLY